MEANVMKNSVMVRIVRVAACVAVVGGVLVGPIGGASASDASIKSAIKSYESKILVSEGRVVTAIGEFKKSGNPGGVKAALTKAIVVLRSLKSAIATQSASSPKVKEGKAKIEKGLRSVILAYQHLKKAFGEKQASPQSAKAEAKKGLSAVRKGRKELREGAKLLR
jgi:hypothetical protein